jgi:hypothetical protein
LWYFYSNPNEIYFMKKLLLFPLLTALVLASCDVIDDPFGSNGPIVPIDTTTVLRKILIEEFTGHRCNNCPDAAAEIKALQASSFGNQIIAVGIHAGPSNFTGTNPNYPTDFTTLEGNEWASFFGLFGLPIGMVSRDQYGASSVTHLRRFEDWGGIANDLRTLPAALKIELEATLSNDSTSVIAQVDLRTLQNLDNHHKLVVLLIENEVVSPQTMPDYSRNVNYKHMFVFRKTFNTAWGEPAFEAGVGTGATFSKQLTLLMDPNWVPANCQIIAYVYDEITQEVKQAEIVDLK